MKAHVPKPIALGGHHVRIRRHAEVRHRQSPIRRFDLQIRFVPMACRPRRYPCAARRQGRLPFDGDPDAFQVEFPTFSSLVQRTASAARPRAHWDAWQRRINRRLQVATPVVLPHRRDRRLTLNSCRYDLIDWAKATMSAAEVAALAGHSSGRTKGRHGRPRAKGSACAADPAVADSAVVGATELGLPPGAKVNEDNLLVLHEFWVWHRHRVHRTPEARGISG